MKWNAFNLVRLSIDKTKKRLFPFNFKEWFKLVIISVLAGGGHGRGFNFNIGSGGGGVGIEVPPTLQALREAVEKYWIVGGVIFFIVSAMSTIWSYIQSIFSFIFIESVINREARFTFRRNHSKGLSLFLFKFLFSIITLVVIAGLAAPYVYHFMRGGSVSVAYIVFSTIALAICFIILWIVFLFMYDLVVPYMYSKETQALFSWKKIWREIGNNKKEVFVYWLARLIMSIAVAIITGIITLLILLGFFLIFVFIGFFIFLTGLLVSKLTGGLVVLVILGIILGIALWLVFLITILMLILPLTLFLKYFGLLNFEKLTQIKILKF